MQPEGEVTGTATGAAGRKLVGGMLGPALHTAMGVEVAQAITRKRKRSLPAPRPGPAATARCSWAGRGRRDHVDVRLNAQKLSGASDLRHSRT